MRPRLIIIRYAQTPRNDIGVIFRHSAIGVDVVPSPARVYDDGVGGGEGDVRDETEERCETKHGRRMRGDVVGCRAWLDVQEYDSRLLLAMRMRRRRVCYCYW